MNTASLAVCLNPAFIASIEPDANDGNRCIVRMSNGQEHFIQRPMAIVLSEVEKARA